MFYHSKRAASIIRKQPGGLVDGLILIYNFQLLSRASLTLPTATMLRKESFIPQGCFLPQFWKEHWRALLPLLIVLSISVPFVIFVFT